LDRLTALVVPRLADGCIVRVRDSVAVAHVDPAKAPLLRRLGRQWDSDRPALFSDLSVERPKLDAEDERILRELAATSGIAIPLQARNRTLGLISFLLSRPGIRYGYKDLALAEDLASRAALAIDNARLYRSEQQAHQRADFLSQASALLDSSIDYQATLTNVAKLVVSSLADWCIIHIVEEDGSVRRLASAHSDPSKAILLREYFQRYPERGLFNVDDVLSGGVSELHSKIPEELIRSTQKDPLQFDLLNRLGFRSAMIVPMRARKQKLGVIKFISGRTDRHFDGADLAVAENLAYRAALAVDNARLYRSAQQAVRAREQFLSIVSHELKTPLTPLKLQLQVIRRTVKKSGGAKKERLDEMLSLAERQGDRIRILIDKLLDVSRIAQGRLRLEREQVDLKDLVSHVVNRFDEDSLLDGVRVTIEASGPVIGSWDRLSLDQMVSNLLSNAIKYGKRKPVAVTVSGNATQALLEVKDQGIGISDEDLKRLFAPFERAVSNRVYGGLGLGLYLVKQIVEAHGGDIRVQSRPGAGSTFSVELPLRKEEQ
jgi:signal transduction histidine kinase